MRTEFRFLAFYAWIPNLLPCLHYYAKIWDISVNISKASTFNITLVMLFLLNSGKKMVILFYTFAVKLVEGDKAKKLSPTSSFNGVLGDGFQYGVTWLNGNEGFKEVSVDRPLTTGNPSKLCIWEESGKVVGRRPWEEAAMFEIQLSVSDWSILYSSWFICLKPFMEESSSSPISGSWTWNTSMVSRSKQSSTLPLALHTKICLD